MSRANAYLEDVEAQASVGTSESERWLAHGILALVVRLVRVVPAVVVAVTHELPGDAHRVAALELKVAALPAVGLKRLNNTTASPF